MIATGLRLRDRHPVVFALAVAFLGALVVLLAVEALATLASLLGLTALHDVGVNTGPVAAIGGAAGGVGAGAGGGGPAPEPPPPPLPFSGTWDPASHKWQYGREPDGPPRPPAQVTWPEWVNLYLSISVELIAGKAETTTRANAGGKA